MIEHVTGNLLDSDAEALVNTVNTVGVMGKGIALQFRQAFPANYEAYRRACKSGEVQPGRMFVFRTHRLTNPKFIINFPTKRHWRGKARSEDIEQGLRTLIEVVKAEGIQSLAVPPLGCGSGGLNWEEIRPKIISAFEELPRVRVFLFAPEGAPSAESMRVATKRPNLTPTRAAIIGLLNRYALPDYRLTMLEVQKLAYFLQVSGEPMRLDFQKGSYGPYAEALNHVLQRMEGHFLRGYGDRSMGASIRLLPGAVNEAEAFLVQHPETRTRLDRVAQLIEGFETPHGMELLATAHWLAQENQEAKTELSAAIRGFQDWNERKRDRFRPEHIEVAWERLRYRNWF